MADHKYQLPEFFGTVTSGSSALRIFGYTFLAGFLTWMVMKGGEIPLTDYYVTGLGDRMNGISHQGKRVHSSDETKEKLRRSFEEFQKNYPQSESQAQAQTYSGAPRGPNENILPAFVTLLVSGLTFFFLVKSNKKQGQQTQQDQIDITKIHRR